MPYTGPLATNRSVNTRMACNGPVAPNNKTPLPCFLHWRGNKGHTAASFLAAAVRELGENPPRTSSRVNNIGYRNVKFLIRSFNAQGDLWFITEKKKMINVP